MPPLLENSNFNRNKACCGVLGFYKLNCKCANKLQLLQFTYTTTISMQPNTPGAMSIRRAVRRSAGLQARPCTTAGPMSCRYPHGVHRQHEQRIQRRWPRWEAHIKQVYGQPSCHTMVCGTCSKCCGPRPAAPTAAHQTKTDGARAQNSGPHTAAAAGATARGYRRAAGETAQGHPRRKTACGCAWPSDSAAGAAWCGSLRWLQTAGNGSSWSRPGMHS